MNKLVSGFVVLFGFVNLAAAQGSPCQPIYYEGNDVFIKVLIQGKEYPAQLTTSNIGMSVTSGLVKELELEERINTNRRIVQSFGEEKVFRYVPKLDFELFGKAVGGVDLAISENSQPGISLTLRLFRDSVIQLDFPESKVCFYPRDAIELRKIKNINLDNDPTYGTPVVQVKLNDSHTWLTFSPEYSGGILVDPVLAETLGLYDQVAEAEPGTGPSQKAVLSTLQFGPYELGDVTIEFPKRGVEDNLTTRNRASTGSHIRNGTASRGKIGMEVLRHFLVTFDLKQERMHVYSD